MLDLILRKSTRKGAPAENLQAKDLVAPVFSASCRYFLLHLPGGLSAAAHAIFSAPASFGEFENFIALEKSQPVGTLRVFVSDYDKSWTCVAFFQNNPGKRKGLRTFVLLLDEAIRAMENKGKSDFFCIFPQRQLSVFTAALHRYSTEMHRYLSYEMSEFNGNHGERFDATTYELGYSQEFFPFVLKGDLVRVHMLKIEKLLFHFEREKIEKLNHRKTALKPVVAKFKKDGATILNFDQI